MNWEAGTLGQKWGLATKIGLLGLNTTKMRRQHFGKNEGF